MYFHWTPDQVDNLSLEIEPWILPIYYSIKEAEANAQDKAIKEAEAKNKNGGGRR